MELINALPAGALHHVFDFLGPRDLCAVGATCQLWHGLQGDAAANQARRISVLTTLHYSVLFSAALFLACVWWGWIYLPCCMQTDLATRLANS